MSKSYIRSVGASLSVIAAAACAGATQGRGEPPATKPVISQAPVDPQTQAAAIAQARADSARHPYTAADVEFMSHMIHHHAQAIVMARWAETHGASPSVQRLADRIINAQQDEIHSMQVWLRDRLQPVPAADPNGMKM